MATAVYGDSPTRHHGRGVLSGSSPSGKHGSLPQSGSYMTGSGNYGGQSNILIPPSPYMTTSTMQHHYPQHHMQQQQQYHHTFIQNQRSGHHFKKKSAVELLAETKQYYVKSDMVRERQQQLHFSKIPSSEISYIVSPSRTLPHHRPNRRSASSSSDLLQTKLRKLLNTGEGKEKIVPDLLNCPTGGGGVGGGSPSKYQSFQYPSTKSLNHELMVHPSNDPQNDHSVFFPSAFLSPQSLPPHPASDDDLYSYGIDEGPELTEDYGTISPPAEYAENQTDDQSNGANNRYVYQRSYSHSQAVLKDPEEYSPSAYNINSHKSLPDLHSQMNRNSPHSEVLSCCSRGNRSNKSSSSFNRDSGGSSGHYTHRSDPCCKQKEPPPPPSTTTIVNSEFRRDSGSSTQHSGNSYYNNYGIISNYRYDCVECRAKMQKESECLMNFTTPEVPEAFQDTYPDGVGESNRYYNSSPRKYYHSQKPPPIPEPPLTTPQDPAELSPPLGTFKRQKCLRFKHRSRYASPSSQQQQQSDDRRPILRSKSDISDRYWNRNAPSVDTQQQPPPPNGGGNLAERRCKSDSVSQLEKFFDNLGLNDESFDQYIAPQTSNSDKDDSDQYLSDVSTVDSNRLPDSTETVTNQNAAMYRPSEPPSIVERNARIIKWLCNCRKLQLLANN